VVIKECEIIRNIFEKRRNMEGKKYMGIIFLVFYLFIMFRGNSKILKVKLLESISLYFCNPYFEI